MMYTLAIVDTLVSFWDSISSFFESIWSIITNFFSTITRFFELLLNVGEIPNFVLSSDMIPPTLKAVFLFVIAVAILKLIVSLGSYSE